MGRFLDEPERPTIPGTRQQLRSFGPRGPSFGDPTFGAEEQKLAQEAKEASKSVRTRRKAKALLEQSLLLFGKMAERTRDQTGLQPGRLAGMVNFFTGALGINPEVQPFVGDKIETATGVAKIAAPSAKVGPDLIRMFGTTLPGRASTFEEARSQIINSISNGIFEELSAGGEEVDVNEIRLQVTDEVDDFIASRPDIFSEISGSSVVPRGQASSNIGRFTVEVE